MFVFFFKQKTAYEMRISDWSSDVCSSDLKRMADLELLNPRDHGRLRAAKRLSTPHFAQIVPAEFGAAAASRPVVLTKDRATGRFYAGAMSGFRPGENFAIEPGAIDRFEPLDLPRGSEDGQVGKEGVRTRRSPWSPDP